MASGSKKTTSKRKSTTANSRAQTKRRAASSSSGKIKSGKTYTDYRVEEEIRIVIALAAAILLMLGNINFAGEVGRTVTNALFGVLGIVEWLFPLIFFFGFSFYTANSMSRLIKRKMTGLVLFVVFLCAFMQLVVYGYSRSDSFTRYYAVCSVEHTGGGFVGSCLVYVFGRAFGTAGAWILVICGLIIAAIVMTQRPIFSELRSKGRKAEENRREERKSREEYQRRRYMETHSGSRRNDSKDRRMNDAHSDELRGHRAVEDNPLRAVTLDESRQSGKTGAHKTRHSGTPDSDRNRRSGTPDEYQNRRSGKTAASPGLYSEKTDTHSGNTNTYTGKPGSYSGKPDMYPGKTNTYSGTPDDYSGIRVYGTDFAMPEFLKEAGTKKKTTASSAALSDAGSEKISSANSASADAASEANKAEAPEKLHQSKEERQKNVEKIALEIADGEKKEPEYRLPPVRLLAKGKSVRGDSRQHLMDTAAKLQQTLQTFGVNVRVTGVSRGPTVTRYELQPEMGVKVSKIINLQDDIKLNLATSEIRIEAPIPGKAAVGIEVPNKEVSPVAFRDLVESEEFRNSKATLPFAVGKDIGGRVVVTDIEKMPHLLIAGATGSGKSVCINTLIMSILYKAKPDEVKMLMIDPKVVELKIYDGIPHLLIPVVTDAKKAAGALNWAVQEMTNRYNIFSKYSGVRDIRAYNERINEENKELPRAERKAKMPRIIIIVDELADLMMVASSEVEDAIVRLTQLARAAGIHLVLATQRPSVNVVTGLIKANIPSRIALAVSSGVDSRTILDMNGAEKLLGRGDMLFYPQGYPKPARVQGGFVSDREITEVVKFLTAQSDETEYNKEIEEQIESGAASAGAPGASEEGDDRDEYFAEAGRLIIEKDKASVGMLQRAFKIGFNRAARIMDQLADAGVVGNAEGTKPRKILMKSEEFEQYLST